MHYVMGNKRWLQDIDKKIKYKRFRKKPINIFFKVSCTEYFATKFGFLLKGGHLEGDFEIPLQMAINQGKIPNDK